MNGPKFHIFVCTSSRVNGKQKGFCEANGAKDLVSIFLEAIEENDLSGEVMVTNTGCFGLCNEGPIVVVYPEGTWYGKVTPEDAVEIVESHILNGNIVARLEI